MKRLVIQDAVMFTQCYRTFIIDTKCQDGELHEDVLTRLADDAGVLWEIDEDAYDPEDVLVEGTEVKDIDPTKKHRLRVVIVRADAPVKFKIVDEHEDDTD